MIQKFALWLLSKTIKKPLTGLSCDDFRITDDKGNEMFVVMCGEKRPGVYDLRVWTKDKRASFYSPDYGKKKSA